MIWYERKNNYRATGLVLAGFASNRNHFMQRTGLLHVTSRTFPFNILLLKIGFPSALLSLETLYLSPFKESDSI